MPNLFETVSGYFKRDDWSYQLVEGQSILQMGFKAPNNAWTCYAQVLEEDQQFIFYSVAPVEIPVEKQMLAMEYITRANYSLVIGNFEMALDRLEVRYKTSIDVEGDVLSYELFRPVVYANLMLMERYLPGLQAIVYEGIKPAAAIEAIESGANPTKLHELSDCAKL